MDLQTKQEKKNEERRTEPHFRDEAKRFLIALPNKKNKDVGFGCWARKCSAPCVAMTRDQGKRKEQGKMNEPSRAVKAEGNRERKKGSSVLETIVCFV